MAAKMESEVTERARQRRRHLSRVPENGERQPGSTAEGDHEQFGSDDCSSGAVGHLKARVRSSTEDEKAQILVEQLRKLPSRAGRKEVFLEQLQELVKA